jgi:hypothetical protein
MKSKTYEVNTQHDTQFEGLTLSPRFLKLTKEIVEGRGTYKIYEEVARLRHEIGVSPQAWTALTDKMKTGADFGLVKTKIRQSGKLDSTPDEKSLIKLTVKAVKGGGDPDNLPPKERAEFDRLVDANPNRANKIVDRIMAGETEKELHRDASVKKIYPVTDRQVDTRLPSEADALTNKLTPKDISDFVMKGFDGHAQGGNIWNFSKNSVAEFQAYAKESHEYGMIIGLGNRRLYGFVKGQTGMVSQDMDAFTNAYRDGQSPVMLHSHPSVGENGKARPDQHYYIFSDGDLKSMAHGGATMQLLANHASKEKISDVVWVLRQPKTSYTDRDIYSQGKKVISKGSLNPIRSKATFELANWDKIQRVVTNTALSIAGKQIRKELEAKEGKAWNQIVSGWSNEKTSAMLNDRANSIIYKTFSSIMGASLKRLGYKLDAVDVKTGKRYDGYKLLKVDEADKDAVNALVPPGVAKLLKQNDDKLAQAVMDKMLGGAVKGIANIHSGGRKPTPISGLKGKTRAARSESRLGGSSGTKPSKGNMITALDHPDKVKIEKVDVSNIRSREKGHMETIKDEVKMLGGYTPKFTDVVKVSGEKDGKGTSQGIVYYAKDDKGNVWWHSSKSTATIQVERMPAKSSSTAPKVWNPPKGSITALNTPDKVKISDGKDMSAIRRAEAMDRISEKLGRTIRMGKFIKSVGEKTAKGKSEREVYYIDAGADGVWRYSTATGVTRKVKAMPAITKPQTTITKTPRSGPAAKATTKTNTKQKNSKTSTSSKYPKEYQKLWKTYTKRPYRLSDEEKDTLMKYIEKYGYIS